MEKRQRENKVMTGFKGETVHDLECPSGMNFFFLSQAVEQSEDGCNKRQHYEVKRVPPGSLSHIQVMFF